MSLGLGQVLSLLICAISLISKYLADDFHANTPLFQNFLNYILLFLVYTTTLAVRQGTHRVLNTLLHFPSVLSEDEMDLKQTNRQAH